MEEKKTLMASLICQTLQSFHGGAGTLFDCQLHMFSVELN
jgi:hypothetical protein